MSKRVLVGGFALAVAMLAGSAPASATPILMVSQFSSGDGANDCAGVFGTPAGPCDVGFPLGETISPFIIKFNASGAANERNGAFPTISNVGSEFSFGGGTWNYSPGDGDPAVRYWVAKGGPHGFNLFWYVSGVGASGLVRPEACDVANPYNLACLDLALAVTGGVYYVPSGGLSHMTFYGSGYGSGNHEVPEPMALVLFGIGAVGAGLARRRQRAAREHRRATE